MAATSHFYYYYWGPNGKGTGVERCALCKSIGGYFKFKFLSAKNIIGVDYFG
jgi:hypothetical protein